MFGLDVCLQTHAAWGRWLLMLVPF